MSTAEGCETIVKQALEHGPIDALLHLVGGFAGGSPVAETSDETWDGMMNINLRSVFLCSREFLHRLGRESYGRIISTHLKDLNEKSPDAHDVPYGTGVSDIPGILAELKRQKFTGNVSIEYEYDWTNNVAEVAQCVGFVRGLGVKK